MADDEALSPDRTRQTVLVEREAAILHWMQQLAPHGIFTTDSDLRIQTWNRWLETHSDFSAGEVIGKPLLEVFPELVERKLDAQFHRALEGQVSVLSTALHRCLLRLTPVERDSGFEHMQQTARIGPLLSYRTVCGTITTIEDVTQREMQARLARQHSQELEDKVRERTIRLDDTVAQLESFSYTVAHDLRAPIRTFKGYTEILLEDYAGEFPEKARDYLERMKRAAVGMELLTRDLLQFSRISRQQLAEEPVDVQDVLNEIVSHNPALQKPGTLTISSPLHSVVGNRTMVQQCLSNLLDNALKFVVADRPAKIIVRSDVRSNTNSTSPVSNLPMPFISPTPDEMAVAAEENHKRVRIYVEDNGVGIAQEYHRKVFGIFERIHGPQKFEGTGIGLAIVARAVQRMHGSCGVESTPGAGSRFWIELPTSP